MKDQIHELIRLYRIVRNANTVKAEVAYRQAKRWINAFGESSKRIKP